LFWADLSTILFNLEISSRELWINEIKENNTGRGGGERACKCKRNIVRKKYAPNNGGK
jgi:hypothetical protein